MASGSIALRGAPDDSIEVPGGKNKPVQVMQLDMTADVVEELLKAMRSGKPPQVLFGSTPVLRYGNQTRSLEATPEKFRHELYTVDEGGNDVLSFSGLFNHKLAIVDAQKAAAGMDSALMALKQNLATLSHEKEARGTNIVSTDLNSLSGRRAAKAHKKGLLQDPTLLQPLKSSPASPAHGGNIPAPPTSAPLSQAGSPLQQALRVPLIHLLAVEPATLTDIAAKLRCKREDCMHTLPKIAREDTSTGEWKLQDKVYKELDIWSFPYRSEDTRQEAIDRAVRALDRMRLSPEEPIWQKLLPKSERGKGKSLSRLNLNAPAMPVHKSTPTMKPKIGGKKAAAAVKKSEAKVNAKDRKVDHPKEDDGRGSSGKLGVKKESQISAEKSNVKKPATKQSIADKKSTGKRSEDHGKSLSTRPKTPSPLRESLSASDLEDDDRPAASKQRKIARGDSGAAVAAKPKSSLKRKEAGDSSVETLTPVSKTSSEGSQPLAKQRKLDKPNGIANSKTSTTRKVNGVAGKYHSRVDAYNDSGASSDTPPYQSSPFYAPNESSADSEELRLSFRQAVELGRHFKKLYENYATLYKALTNAEQAPTDAQRRDLMHLHHRLEKMKSQIASAKGA